MSSLNSQQQHQRQQPQPPQQQQALPPHVSPQPQRSTLMEPTALRVALPEEHSSIASPQNQLNDSFNSTLPKMAHVKPFVSPSSRDHVTANWNPQWNNPLATNGYQPLMEEDGTYGYHDQSADLDRSNSFRSRSVLPPSGAARPINHIEVNKVAQVC